MSFASSVERTTEPQNIFRVNIKFLILHGPNLVIKSHIVTASSGEYHVSLKVLCHILSFTFLKIKILSLNKQTDPSSTPSYYIGKNETGI